MQFFIVISQFPIWMLNNWVPRLLCDLHFLHSSSSKHATTQCKNHLITTQVIASRPSEVVGPVVVWSWFVMWNTTKLMDHSWALFETIQRIEKTIWTPFRRVAIIDLIMFLLICWSAILCVEAVTFISCHSSCCWLLKDCEFSLRGKASVYPCEEWIHAPRRINCG